MPAVPSSTSHIFMSAMWNVWFADPNMLWPLDFHLPRINLQIPEESWDNNIGFSFFNVTPLQCKIHTYIYIQHNKASYTRPKCFSSSPFGFREPPIPALGSQLPPNVFPFRHTALVQRKTPRQNVAIAMWWMTVVDDRLGAFQVFQARCSEVNAHYLWSFWNL